MMQYSVPAVRGMLVANTSKLAMEADAIQLVGTVEQSPEMILIWGSVTPEQMVFAEESVQLKSYIVIMSFFKIVSFILIIRAYHKQRTFPSSHRNCIRHLYVLKI